MHHTLHTLPNGLRVLLVPVSNATTATVMVMAGTGSRFESARENGLAHFLEHMFFKGTARRPTARAISEELDAVGSISNAFTGKDRTAYYAKVSSRYIEQALDVISDIFLNSTLPSREITKERGAIIQEIDMYADMPAQIVNDVFDALLLGGDHPLGRTTIGPKENILRFTRKDFAKYFKNHYTAHNTVVCVAGGFPEERIRATIAKTFCTLTDGVPVRPEPFVAFQNAPRVAIRGKKTDQTHLILGVPAYPYLHKDEFALGLLATILGGGMSSRLFMEVREKRGLAYSVHAWVDKFVDTGYLAVQAGVEHAKLEKTIMTVLVEFRRIKREFVTPQELAKAKAYIRGTRTIRLEASDALAEHVATSVVNFGRVRMLDEVLEGVDAVTAEDIHRVAKDIFRTQSLNLAVIGPHVDSEKLRTLLCA